MTSSICPFTQVTELFTLSTSVYGFAMWVAGLWSTEQAAGEVHDAGQGCGSAVIAADGEGRHSSLCAEAQT